MLLRRRLMCLKSKTNPVQHYDDDGNAYDALDCALSLGLGVQLSDDLDMDSNALGINLSVALSNDLDKDTDALGINVSIALEAV